MQKDLEKIVPVEDNNHPGYYCYPGNSKIRVSKDGKIILDDGTLVLPYLHQNGYYYFNAYGKNYKHHRVLAMTFVGRPFRHIDKPYSKLEVNHLDGVKTNNDLNNLEWCTCKENIIHSHKNGLHPKDRRVLAKNIHTDEIITFNSTKDCADYFNIHRGTFWKHITKGNIGAYQKDRYVFKFDNGELWNVLPKTQLKLLGGGTSGIDVLVTNFKDKCKLIFASISEAAVYTGISAKLLSKKLKKGDIYLTEQFSYQKLNER
jgi:hypothetical protein